LNKVIDRNYYPVKEAENSNLRHRPLYKEADAFIMLRLPLHLMKLSFRNFETLYFAAVTASMEMAKVEGPYSTFEGSPILRRFHNLGILKMKNYQAVGTGQNKNNGNGVHSCANAYCFYFSNFGNNEAFEPYTSNITYASCIVW
jgi:ribonucleoside-diphosphate reductase alpha chain